MSFRYRPIVRAAQTIRDWPRPAKTAFIESRAYRLLRDEVERYVAGEFAGRSVLISGHRGAGKTTLVARVVQDVADAAFDGWIAALERKRAPETPLRRPLLVKLHGPSLAAAARADAAKAAEPDPPPAEKAGEADAKKEPADKKPAAPSLADLLAHNALMQIAISLYRALAGEFSVCYANQAASASSAEQSLYEIAAQFRLDVDQAIDPLTARDYWEWVGCARTGVLWPRAAVDKGEPAPPVARDQGMLEIQALVTAGQCYRVCSGAVAAQEKSSNAATQEVSWQTKLGADLTGLVNRLASLSIGGLAGYGAQGALGAAIGAGLVAAATGTLSAGRSRKREANLDYSFIRDFSPVTLERDLPLVIERARAAGLAPIFVVDELDKLDKETELSIQRLIDRLKHLTTDFGFFCFLTGVDYFETIERKVRTSAFPREHSYFSERLLIVTTPNEIAEYLDRVIVEDLDADASEGRKQASKLARAMTLRLLMYRSRLNLVELMRARTSAAQREFDDDPFDLAASFRDRLIVSVQLAIEHRLQKGPHAEELERSPWLRQLTVDALYRFAREWDGGARTFEESEAALAADLLHRLPPEAEVETIPVGRVARTKKEIVEKPDVSTKMKRRLGETHFQKVFRVSRFCDEMKSFVALHETLDQPPKPLAIDAIPRELSSGLFAKANGDHRFDVGFDSSGELSAATNEDADQAFSKPLREAIEINAMLITHLAGLHLSAEDGRELGLLPPTFSWRAASGAVFADDGSNQHRLRGAAVGRKSEVLSAAATLKSWSLPPSQLRWAQVLTWEMGVVWNVILETGARKDPELSLQSTPDVICRLRRFYDFRLAPDYSLAAFDEDFIPMPHPDSESICSPGWRDFLSAASKASEARRRSPLNVVQRRQWRGWEARLTAKPGSPKREAFEFDDLWLAAADLRPSSLFRIPTPRMTPLEWSRIVLEAASTAAKYESESAGQPSADETPAWLALAGLAALEFPRPILEMLFPNSDDGSFPGWDAGEITPPDLISSAFAPRRGQGTVIIYQDAAFALSQPNAGPCLFVAEDELSEYDPAWNWLRSRGVFSTFGLQGSDDEYEA